MYDTWVWIHFNFSFRMFLKSVKEPDLITNEENQAWNVSIIYDTTTYCMMFYVKIQTMLLKWNSCYQDNCYIYTPS